MPIKPETKKLLIKLLKVESLGLLLAALVIITYWKTVAGLLTGLALVGVAFICMVGVLMLTEIKGEHTDAE